MALSLRLLGAPLVEVDGSPLAVDTRKATALLAYLAVETRVLRRDSIAARFWPEADSERARSALRRTLSTLKSALDAGRLVVAGDTVALNVDELELDVARFRSLAAGPAGVDDLRAAVELYRGPFLDGFGLRDAPDFDDWQQLVGDELRREFGAVLDRLVDAEAAAGRGPAAIAAARRRLALDPLHEPAHRRLIELYDAGGDRSAALAQYRDCVRVLNRELGVAPLEETTTLYRAVREGAAVPRAQAVVPPLPAARAALPLVGRGDELGLLHEAHRKVGAGGHLVIVEGEAGVGKTRLADELLGALRVSGTPAAVVRAFEDEAALTYGTLIELLRSALRGGRLGEVPAQAAAEAARLLPELGPAAADPLDTPGAQARFYDGVVTTLLGLLGGGPAPVIVFDDLHWADAATLEVLAYLTRRLRGRPVLIVATLRSETPAGHPARRVLGEAARNALASVIELDRLDRAAVDELVAAAGAPPAFGERLFAETRGLPFFIVEYLETRPDTSEEWPLPAGVRSLLETRFAQSSEIATQVAAAAAVLGRPFALELVRDVSGRSDEETAAGLDELVARGLLSDVEPSQYEFRHEQARRVAYDRSGAGRRRLLHRRAGEAIASGARGTASAGAVAQHFALAGDDELAAEWFRRAGDHARSLFANHDALAFYREALVRGHGEAVALETAVGDLQTLDGDYAAALESYETAAAHAEAREMSAIEHRIALVHHRRGEWELAEASLATAAAGLSGDQVADRARVAADRALNEHRRGRDEIATAFAEEALALAAAAAEPRALAQAHNLLGILAAGEHRLADARAQLEQSLALAGDDEIARAAALNNLALLCRDEGELEQALELTGEALELAARVGDRHRHAALLNNTADLLNAAGRRDEAMELLKQAVAIFAEIGDGGVTEPEIWKLREW